ncbi:MAG: DUF4011 domain-containing protein [Saprospiraceae bacterium]|nr:DUF4011 domain-containing protein [Saprospiraceae bacterium]
MNLTRKLLTELQKKLKIGNRRSVHLNAIPANSRYKFDLNRLAYIEKNLPNNFLNCLLTVQPLRFKISWMDNVPDLNLLFEEDQIQLIKISKAFEILINQTEAIESEKGINTFGLGFPIIIRRDQQDNKLTVAPILIWSLRIKRTKEFNTWEISRTEDDPIYLNEVLINHLQSDSKILIEQIPSELLDDGLIDKNELIEICVNLIKTINTTTSVELKENFKSKIENISSIKDKVHYEKLSINSNNAFIEFGGLFSIFEVQKQNIINDYSKLIELEGLKINLDNMVEHSFQPISSVETDPTQQSILHSLESKRNILIQGPPGTGKSQTLTAILINALENKKKTIVVCEKRTALEVLHNALIEKGLNYHCVLIRDIVKDRKTVVDSVRNRVENSSYRHYHYNFSKETLDNLIAKSMSLINSINNRHNKLEEKLLGNKSWTDIVGNLLQELKGFEHEDKLVLDNIEFNYSSQELNDIINLLQNGERLYKDFKQIENFSFINPEKLTGVNPHLIEQSINKDFEHYISNLKRVKALELEYKKDYFRIRKLELINQLDKFNEIEMSINLIYEAHQENVDLLNEVKTSKFIYRLLGIISRSKKQILLSQAKLKMLFLELKNHFEISKDLSAIDFSNSLESNLLKLRKIRELIYEVNLKFNQKIENEFEGIRLLSLHNKNYETNTLELLQNEVNEFKKKIIDDNWIINKLNITQLKSFIEDLEKIIECKNIYFSNQEDLFTIEFKWYQFYNQLHGNNKLLIEALLTNSNWKKSFLIHYLNSILVIASNDDLPTNENDHIELVNTLNGLEKEQIRYVREFWFSKQIESKREFEQRNVNLSVENLYNKRSSNRFKRLSLRQIIQYDTNLFTTFFPIILTSPDVSSNLFKGMNEYFDIVMFDESSQLRLEDNLPALLKGKQIIIAGDEHQMPPSNYFNKVFDGTIEDEDDLEEEDEIKIDQDNLLLSCESLLEFASEMKFEKKYLDFHYRSRHPYLIEFSNFAFYNQRLMPLPNNFDYIPIKYIQVNGTFTEHSNEAEAEMVLSIIETNIGRLPNGNYPTIGIATFNIAQRNLIKSKILERKKFSKFENFNAKIQELEENGLFIKNLENIQGDERDVIILSTTYGTGVDGKFAQRFGPINHSKGYRLLNVIITRAKYKVYVCSSVPEKYFLDYKSFLITEGNNKKAILYAYLAYSKAVSESNDELRLAVLTSLARNTEVDTMPIQAGLLESPFEEEVFQTLVHTFGENKLFPQFQFAGFRIDIVYDSKIKGIPKIAIECDGAKYHSGREAYLYDIHRQKQLEKHGFVFHRI